MSVGVVVMAAIGLGIAQAVTVSNILRDVPPSVAALIERPDATAEDRDGAVGALEDETGTALGIVDSAPWRFAAQLPMIGPSVAAVRHGTAAVHLLVAEALRPGMRVVDTVRAGALTLPEGGVNLDALRGMEADLAELAAATRSAAGEIAQVDRTALMPPVSESISELADLVDTADATAELGNRLIPVVRPMLGEGGVKRYLVIFQNNAEIRATGGNAATALTVVFDEGRMTLADQSETDTYYYGGVAGTTSGVLSADAVPLYRDGLTRFPQDYTMTPDYPTTASLFRKAWMSMSVEPLDGVLSVDPVVLAEMLKVAGPVSLPDGRSLSGPETVDVVLRDAYVRYPGADASDAFFRDVARAIFDQLSRRALDPIAMGNVLAQAAAEQRVYASFDDPAAQALAEELAVDGSLTTDNVARTQVGIYLNDYSVSKLEYYLDTAVNVTCDTDRREVTVSLSMANRAPAEIDTPRVPGERNARFGLAPTTMMLDVLMLAPPGAEITGVSQGSDIPGEDRAGVDHGHAGRSITIAIPSGEKRTVAFTVSLDPAGGGPLDLRYSPTAGVTPATIDAACEGVTAPR